MTYGEERSTATAFPSPEGDGGGVDTRRSPHPPRFARRPRIKSGAGSPHKGEVLEQAGWLCTARRVTIRGSSSRPV
jgi:hypothetical protein